MTFTRSRSKAAVPPILTLEGTGIERVASYKYPGIWLDEKFTFNVHIENLLKKLRPKLGFFFKEMLPFQGQKENCAKLFFICIRLW